MLINNAASAYSSNPIAPKDRSAALAECLEYDQEIIDVHDTIIVGVSFTWSTVATDHNEDIVEVDDLLTLLSVYEINCP